MASTKTYSEIEKKMAERFLKKHEEKKLKLKKIKNIFLGFVPDIVGFSKKRKTCIVGEITFSGYFGHKGKDLHIRTIRKLSDCFVKCCLYNLSKKEIIKKLNKQNLGKSVRNMEFYFIVPKGARFLNVMGVREKLFEMKFFEKKKLN